MVISGIKPGDGKIRAFFLKDLRNGTIPQSTVRTPSFFHQHKGGQLYCYPYRDYRKRELPRSIQSEMKQMHPYIKHSGCSICPVLVLFNDRIKGDATRRNRSLEYLKKLIAKGKFTPSPTLLQYVDLSQSKLHFKPPSGAGGRYK